MPRLEAGTDADFWKKVLKRTMLIFGIGLFLNWWPFVKWEDGVLVFKQWSYLDSKGNPQGVRILGVLQRIALCYFFAAVIIYYLKIRKAFYVGMVLLLLYWMICYVANPSDPFSIKGWFGTSVDKSILGVAHMYKGEGMPFDPEGFGSLVPAIVQVIFGYLVGDYIRRSAENKPLATAENNARLQSMLNGLFVTGLVMIFAGFCWDMVFPINKKIWTSSYVVYTTGLAMLILGSMIYVIEIKQVRGGLASFFDVFGKNALFVFALSAFLPKGFALIRLGEGVNPWNWLYKKLLIHIPGPPENGSLAYALCVITFMWAICWWMDRRKIYIKV
jgi:predicted acyltransferase